MRAALACAVLLGAAPVHAVFVPVFDPFMTVSYEQIDGTITDTGSSYLLLAAVEPWKWAEPAREGELVDPNLQAQTQALMTTDMAMGCEGIEEVTEPTPGPTPPMEYKRRCSELSGPDVCIVPPEGQPTNWHDVIRVGYGIEVARFQEWNWPGSDNRVEALKHIEAMMQPIHAAAKRDIGLELNLVHVHLREHPLDDTDDALDYVGTEARWKTQLDPVQPVKFVLRLLRIGGGNAKMLSRCPISRILVARTGYYFTVPPYDHSAAGTRLIRSVLHTVAQELFHSLLGLSHTQCYRHADGETPIDICSEIACGVTVPSVCPPITELSWMSYCASCYNYNPTPQLMPNLRLGHFEEGEWLIPGPMLRVARWNLLAMNQQCPDYAPVVDLMPTGVGTLTDADEDGFPTAFDSCAADDNEFQQDADGDGIGDACDSGCAVVPGVSGSAWPLLLGVLALVARRARR